jgi:hypothetical protein
VSFSHAQQRRYLLLISNGLLVTGAAGTPLRPVWLPR